jgi:hypothetical protein
MLTVTTPTGWTYEGPDYSVGIFGGGWIHEDCPVDTEDEVNVTEEPIKSEHHGVGAARSIRTTYQLTCSACGQSTEVADEDWDPEPGSMDEDW